MLSVLYIGCELLYAAAQAWFVLQLIGGIFEPARTGKRQTTGQAVLMVLMAALRLGNAGANASLFSNAVLMAGILILTAGSVLLFLCGIPDALFLNALGLAGLALGDLTAQALIRLVLEAFRGESGFTAPGPGRGLYFLAWTAGLTASGPPLRRWLAGKRTELLEYRKTLPLLLIPMLLSLICYQQFPGESLGRWAVFFSCSVLLFLALWLGMVKHEAEYESKMLQLKMSMLESGYQELFTLYNERAILVHDMKNHLRTVSAILDENRPEEASAYLSRITEGLERGTPAVWCGHEMMNLVLNMKFRQARKAQIKVECHCDDMSGLALTSPEICALFSNLLDNAIEANEKCPADRERWIKLLCARRERMLMISLSNPVAEEAAYRGRRLFETAKQDGTLHGLGMRSVKKVIDSYHGNMKAEVRDNEFCIVIYLAVFIQKTEDQTIYET